MKKTLSLILGILFLTTCLYTVSCNNKRQSVKKDAVAPMVASKNVEIYLSYYIINGEGHLFMHDTLGSSIDNLETSTQKNSTVVWLLDKKSGIQRLEKIMNLDTIIEKPPELMPDFHQIKVKIKDNADTGRYKYGIVFTPWNGEKDTIDPYIRIQD